MTCQRILACRAIAMVSDRNIADRHIADRNDSNVCQCAQPHFCDMRSRDRNIADRRTLKLFFMDASVLRGDVVH